MSSITLLWFGESVLIAHDGTIDPIPLSEKGDSIAQIAGYVAAHFPKQKSVQLIYAPVGLDPVKTACPRGSKAVIEKIISNDFPAIDNPNNAWAALTPIEYDGFYTSLVYIETRPRIARLAMVLGEHGILLRGAWPLAAAAELFSPNSRPIFVFSTDDTIAVYSITANAARNWGIWSHVGFMTDALTAINHALSYSIDGDKPPMFLISHGQVPDFSPSFPAESFVQEKLENFLRVADQLDSKSSSNFYPPEFAFPWNRLGQLVAGALFILSVIFAVLYVRDYQQMQDDNVRKAALTEKLRVDVEHLKANKTLIEANLAFAKDVNPPSSAIRSLLDIIVRNVPTAVTVHELNVRDNNFTISGTLHEGLNSDTGPYSLFVTALNQSNGLWTLTPGTRTRTESPQFSITGTFNTPKAAN